MVTVVVLSIDSEMVSLVSCPNVVVTLVLPDNPMKLKPSSTECETLIEIVVVDSFPFVSVRP